MGIPVSHWRFRLSGEVGFTAGFTGFTGFTLSAPWTLQLTCNGMAAMMAVTLSDGSGRGRAGSFASDKRQGGF